MQASSSLTQIPEEVSTETAVSAGLIMDSSSPSVTSETAEAGGWQATILAATELIAIALREPSAVQRLSIISSIIRATATISKARLSNMVASEAGLCVHSKNEIHIQLERSATTGQMAVSQTCHVDHGYSKVFIPINDSAVSAAALGRGGARSRGQGPGVMMMSLPSGWGPRSSAESAAYHMVEIEPSILNGALIEPCGKADALHPCVEAQHKLNARYINETGVEHIMKGRGLKCLTWHVSEGQQQWREDKCKVKSVNFSGWNGTLASPLVSAEARSVATLNTSSAGPFIHVSCDCWTEGVYTATFEYPEWFPPRLPHIDVCSNHQFHVGSIALSWTMVIILACFGAFVIAFFCYVWTLRSQMHIKERPLPHSWASKFATDKTASSSKEVMLAKFQRIVLGQGGRMVTVVRTDDDANVDSTSILSKKARAERRVSGEHKNNLLYHISDKPLPVMPAHMYQQ